jgi:hypothetical protein
MLARSTTIGLLAAIALSLPVFPESGHFMLQSTGAVRLAAAGTEARYGMVPESINHRPVLAISLGQTQAAGSLSLYTYGDNALRAGRYRVVSSLSRERSAEREFHVYFVAGSPQRPLGAFNGESGSVTITHAEGRRVSGEFEIHARGFLADNPQDEEHWVTVQGGFSAEGDSANLAIKSVSASTR